MRLLNTLYVTIPDSYLRLDNDTLRIEVERETRLRVPMHHLTAVVCFGHVGLSAPLMHRLADAGIALVLLDNNGRFKARSGPTPWPRLPALPTPPLRSKPRAPVLQARSRMRGGFFCGVREKAKWKARQPPFPGWATIWPPVFGR